MQASSLLFQEGYKLKNSFAQLLDSPVLLINFTDAENYTFQALSEGVGRLCALRSNNVEGLTPVEIKRNVRFKSTLNIAWANNTNRMHDLVCAKKKMLQHQSMFTNGRGIVKILHVRKAPVMNNQKKVTLVINYSEDITHQYDLFSLLKLYQAAYQSQADIVKYFLKHLSLEEYFNELPTVQELEALLTFSLGKMHAKNINAFDNCYGAFTKGMTTMTDKMNAYTLNDISGNILAYQSTYTQQKAMYPML